MKRRYLRIYFWSILLFCLCNQVLFAGQKLDTLDSQIGGLKFLSKEVFVPDRTSFSLFSAHKKFNSSFTLSFDCSIYNAERFGYIFRMIDYKEDRDKGQPFLHLLYNNQIDDYSTTDSDTLVNLELYSPVTHAKLDFLIPAQNQKKLQIKIHYDARRQEIRMNCNGVEKTLDDITLKEGLFNIVFGLWGQNTDVAAMELRNVRIRESGKTEFFWPLNEFSGAYAVEQLSGIRSEIKNPVWLRKEHFHWQKLKSFEADEMVGVVFKERYQKIYLINKDSLLIFSPSSGDIEILKYSNERPFLKEEHYSIYNPSTDEIISYDFHFFESPANKPTYSILNENSLEWSRVDETNDFAVRYHHGTFWNRENDRLISFGGYGDFEYFNEFSVYDFSNDNWSQLVLKGDTIYPRTHSVIGSDEDNGLFYIYGGFGNEEGQQALGGRIFSDLYAVDIANEKIEKLLDYQDNDIDFVPRGHLIVDNEGKDFYTIGSKMIEKSFLQLYHLSPQNETINVISDSIPVIFSNMSGDVFLFKNDLTQELYCVSRENNESGSSLISIYRLKFPPSHLLVEEVVLQQGYLKLVTILFIIIIGVAGGIYAVRKSSLFKRKSRIEKPIQWSRETKNAIWFLGGFKVYDHKGMDITYRFSTKLRELFLLVFFETLNNQGISSKDLSEILWPGMDKNHQKNNRGVTISNLRKALEDLQGIKLINQNNKWKIEYEEDFYSDFIELKKALAEKEDKTKPDYLISIFSFGKILPHLEFNWLKNNKAEYESEAIDILYRICANFYSEKKYLSCLEAARIIHEKFDPFDEVALGFKIKALNKMKSYKKSQDEFELFKKRYFLTHNAEYFRTYQEIENLQPNLDSLI